MPKKTNAQLVKEAEELGRQYFKCPVAIDFTVTALDTDDPMRVAAIVVPDEDGPAKPVVGRGPGKWYALTDLVDTLRFFTWTRDADLVVEVVGQPWSSDPRMAYAKGDRDLWKKLLPLCEDPESDVVHYAGDTGAVDLVYTLSYRAAKEGFRAEILPNWNTVVFFRK